jgi:hypothetical protein
MNKSAQNQAISRIIECIFAQNVTRSLPQVSATKVVILTVFNSSLRDNAHTALHLSAFKGVPIPPTWKLFTISIGRETRSSSRQLPINRRDGTPLSPAELSSRPQLCATDVTEHTQRVCGHLSLEVGIDHAGGDLLLPEEQVRAVFQLVGEALHHLGDHVSLQLDGVFADLGPVAHVEERLLEG